MPLALVFTSAPQGLAPGRTGYCTVARHAEMPERLATLLEGLGTPHAAEGSSTFTLRRLEAGGRGWFVLSRFTSGGLDYTSRDNRLAHHLVFSEEETAALPPPADIARRWTGWVSQWGEAPRWLDPLRIQLAPGQTLIPCASWRRLTGTGAKAAWLVQGESPVGACLINAGDAETALGLLAESGALIGRAAWTAAFTTDPQVTGAEGFTWCVGEAAGRRRVDLAAAASEPAPEGEKARLAAMGLAIRPVAAAASPAASHHPAPAPRAGLGVWLAGALLVTALGSTLFWLTQRRSAPLSPPPEPRQAARAPTAEELAAAAAILRSNAALRELEDVVARGDLVTAARQWTEISQITPEFTARHRDRFVPRIQSGIAAAAAAAAERQLGAAGAPEDPRTVERLLAETREAVRIAGEIGAPRDAAWARLAEMERRLRFLAELDIRDTWLVAGSWVTGSAGPGAPSTADFDIGKETGEHVARFLREGLTGGAGTSTAVTIRLCDFRALGQRDNTSRPLRARLEPGASSLWVSEETGGGRRPSLTLSVGARANVVSVNLVGPAPADFTATNRAVELTNPAGRRLCVALLARPEAVLALQPGLGGLAAEPGTLATGPAGWIEPVFLRTRMAGARMGLYPSTREFPDRVASLSCSRNLIETDLLRQAGGDAGVGRAAVAERRRQLEAGDTVAAGAPWSIRFVDARGEPLINLSEFR